MYKDFIFDIDGTLIDTKYAHMASLQKLVWEEQQRHVSLETCFAAFGYTDKAALESVNIPFNENSLEHWNRLYDEYQVDCKIFHGLEAIIGELKSSGCRLGIVTSRGKYEIKPLCDQYPVLKYFDCIITADDTAQHKPMPEPILKYLEKSGALRTSSVYIGDMNCDFLCAANAGIPFAFAGWGRCECLEAIGGIMLNKPEDLLALAYGASNL